MPIPIIIPAVLGGFVLYAIFGDEKKNNHYKQGGKIEDFCPEGTEIQTLIFDKDWYTKDEAKEWANHYDFKYGKVDEKENTFRIRQQNPSKIQRHTFRTIELREGIKAVIGCPITQMAEGGKIYDTTIIAKMIREQLKNRFPNLRFSVTKDRNSIDIALMKSSINPFVREYEYTGGKYPINHHYVNSDSNLNERGKKIFTEVEKIANQWNWDNSDSMTDYFDVNYYLHVQIGKWDKDFEISRDLSAKRERKSARVGNFKQKSTTKQIESIPLTSKINGVQIFKNEKRNGVEVRFDKRPDYSVIQWMKDNGFRWTKFGGAWYKKYSDEAVAKLKSKFGIYN